MLHRWGVLQDNLVLSTGLIMSVGHHEEIQKLRFSFWISLRWPIHIINPVDKTKYFFNHVFILSNSMLLVCWGRAIVHAYKRDLWLVNTVAPSFYGHKRLKQKPSIILLIILRGLSGQKKHQKCNDMFFQRDDQRIQIHLWYYRYMHGTSNRMIISNHDWKFEFECT